MTEEDQQEEEQMQEKIVNEEYKTWKKNAPFLYDLMLSNALEWPTLTTQWLPDKQECVSLAWTRLCITDQRMTVFQRKITLPTDFSSVHIRPMKLRITYKLPKYNFRNLSPLTPQTTMRSEKRLADMGARRPKRPLSWKSNSISSKK